MDMVSNVTTIAKGLQSHFLASSCGCGRPFTIVPSHDCLAWNRCWNRTHRFRSRSMGVGDSREQALWIVAASLIGCALVGLSGTHSR